jgi:hypothetical protein
MDIGIVEPGLYLEAIEGITEQCHCRVADGQESCEDCCVRKARRVRNLSLPG